MADRSIAIHVVVLNHGLIEQVIAKGLVAPILAVLPGFPGAVLLIVSYRIRFGPFYRGFADGVDLGNGGSSHGMRLLVDDRLVGLKTGQNGAHRRTLLVGKRQGHRGVVNRDPVVAYLARDRGTQECVHFLDRRPHKIELPVDINAALSRGTGYLLDVGDLNPGARAAQAPKLLEDIWKSFLPNLH